MSLKHPIVRTTPTVDEAVALVKSLPDNGMLTLESLQAQHDLERQLYCQELDELAKKFAREDSERRKLWGNKFPRRIGDKPPEPAKSINQVKSKNRKRRGKGRNALGRVE